MRNKILFTLTLLGGAWVGVLMHRDPGYVLLSYRHLTIESTLWFALIFLFVVCLLLGLTFRSGFNLIAMPGRLQRWRALRKKDRDHDDTLRGIQYLIQGDWSKAEKKLSRLANHHPHRLISLLFAAKAASGRGDIRKRDDYLKDAFNHAPEEQLAILLTQAQLQLEHFQHEQALATLKQLHQKHPQHLWVAGQLANLYYRLKEWPSLAALLPLLKKHRCLDHDTLVEMEIHAYSDLYKHADSFKTLQKCWHATSKDAQQSPEALGAYCHRLIALDHVRSASTLLKKQLTKQWDDRLLCLYQAIGKASPSATLKILLSWQKSHPKSAPLLAQIGLCYLDQGLMGKAKEALQECVLLDQKQKRAWQALASMAEKDNDLRQAMHYLKQCC